MARTEQEKRLLEWQRKFDPSNFNQKRGAQFHTAPTVVMPGANDYPTDVPENAITILFRISDECWFGKPEKLIMETPIIGEREARKGSKHGPILILDETAMRAAIPYKENYYWAAQVLTKHQVLRMTFIPEKLRRDGKKRYIVVYATFIPVEE